MLTIIALPHLGQIRLYYRISFEKFKRLMVILKNTLSHVQVSRIILYFSLSKQNVTGKLEEVKEEYQKFPFYCIKYRTEN